jgi:hypothetical protein
MMTSAAAMNWEPSAAPKYRRAVRIVVVNIVPLFAVALELGIVVWSNR